MPFKADYAVVAELVRTRYLEVAGGFFAMYNLQLPEINRLDWVRSTGAIQDQIWQELISSDLIFCDISDCNPNVMFEAGVAAAWKPIHKVVFIKNKASESKNPFDISPFRYIEYDLTSHSGIEDFRASIERVVIDAIIPFPDEQILAPSINLPLSIDFSEGMDDPRIYTPPYCHRRVVDGALQFGSLFSYPHSWASVGNAHFDMFSLEFEAKFGNIITPNSDSKIGIGLRSQHFYANYSHVFVLGADGSILITEPNNDPPHFYSDIFLRGPTNINPYMYHVFNILFNESILTVKVDDFSKTFQVREMKRTYGPGLVRFHATRSWMDLKRLTLREA